MYRKGDFFVGFAFFGDWRGVCSLGWVYESGDFGTVVSCFFLVIGLLVWF